MAQRVEIQLPFPVNGVDKSMPPGNGLPLTTRDAMNVEGVPPGTLYLGGGQRGGHVKGFGNSMGNEDAGPPGKTISGGIVAVRAWNQLVAQEGNYVNVTDTFAAYPGQFSILGAHGEDYGVRIGTDFRGEYTNWAKNPALAYATPDPSTTTGTQYGDPGGPNGTNAFPSAPYLPRTIGWNAPFLQARSSPPSATDEYILGINYKLATSVKVNIRTGAGGQYSTYYGISGNRGASYPGHTNGQCTQIGPVIKASPNFGNFVCAYLTPTALNTVRLVIETHVAGVVTQYPSGNTFPLTVTNFGDYDPSNLSIEMSWTATAVRARVVWADQNIDDTVVKTVADIAALGAGQPLETTNRGGVIFRHTGYDIWRLIKSLEYTKIVPLESTVLFTVNAADVDLQSGHWQVKKGLESFYADTVNVEAYSGLAAAYVNNGATPPTNYPVFDRVGISPATGVVASPQIYGGTTANVGQGGVFGTPQGIFRAMFPSAWATDAAVAALTEVPDVEITFAGSDGTIDDGVGAIVSLGGIEGTY